MTHHTPPAPRLRSEASRLAVLALLTGVATSACLSDRYMISHAELRRIAALPPAERGKHVRVRQGVDYELGDPIAEEEEGEAVEVFVDEEEPRMVVRVEADPRVVGHHHPRHSWVGYRGHSGPRSTTPTVRIHPRVRTPPPRVSRVHPRVHGSSPLRSSGAKTPHLIVDRNVSAEPAALAVMAVVAVAAVGIVAVGLAATEGAKYDGWLSLDPKQRISFRSASGDLWAVRLDELTAQDLKHGTAYVERSEIDEDDLLLRAPLDRRGMSLRFELGLGESEVSRGTTMLMPSALVGLGYNPIQELGITAFFRPVASNQGVVAFGSRSGLQLDAFLLRRAGFHVGLFGWAGLSFQTYEGKTNARTTQFTGFGGGVVTEMDLTTTLVLSWRVGADFETRDGTSLERPPAIMSTLGMAVY